MARLTRRLHRARDLTRRWTRRGVARAVLEHRGETDYMETHPIAAEMASTYGTKKIERFATERQVAMNGGGTSVFGMAVAPHPKAATWPR